MIIAEHAPFTDAFTDVSRGNTRIPLGEVKNCGTLPVIDQGKAAIAGYIDDAELAVATQGPIIVFGDHTRAVKYIDFPFAMGADGTKLLQPKPGFDARFLYHFLLNVDLSNAGYSRHFKFLKRVRVPRFDIDEQRRIASILDEADALRTKRRAQLAHLDELPQALFHDMFGDPATNPLGFPVRDLDSLVEAGRPITYGILKPGPDVENGVPYVRVADMKADRISLETVRRTTAMISMQYRRSILREGDLLMSIRGHVGRFAHVPAALEGGNITQDSARLSFENSCTSTYVREAMAAPGLQHWMRRHTKGVAVRGLNIGDLRRVPVPLPPFSLQHKFADRISAMRAERDRIAKGLEADEELFAALRHRAFRGEL